MNLDLSFYNWELFTSYIQKGLIFSVQLTIIATIGGIVLGTVLALMRLSGKTWLALPATAYVNTMRSITRSSLPLVSRSARIFSHHEELSILSIGEYCFGLVYIRANCRASACGDPVTPNRAAECGHCIRHDHHTKLSLCIVTDGDAHHRSTTHIGVYEYCEELIRCICSVCAGTHFICFTGSGGNVARY